MRRRIAATLICAAGIALTVGVRSHSSEAAAPRDGLDISGDTVVAAALKLNVADRVSFELTITNNTSKRVELRFPSGRTHDFVVLDSLGREVWRWSAGRLFTQVLQNRLVGAHESIKFVESWKNPDTTGSFTAVAVLRSRNYPLEQRAQFILPAERD